MRIPYVWAAVLALSFLIACGGARAHGVCTAPIGFVASVQGQVEVRKAGAGPWRPAGLSEPLCAGDVIRVGHRSRALASIAGQPTVRIDQNSTLRLVGAPKDQPFLFQFMQGAAYFFSRRPRTLTIETPFVTAGIRGTEFLVRADKAQSLITVFEGEVRARNDQGRAAVAAGETVIARAGEAPVPSIVAKPRDAVQWALYFPVILLSLADRSGAAAQAAPPTLRAAIDAAARNKSTQAFAQFDQIDAADRDAAFYVYRAATLLNVGRVEEAHADIDRALAEDPQNGEAYALRAVIAVARNEKAEALADAQRAVELRPRSAAAKMALSYAQQAYFELNGARQTLEQAVAEEPDNALAWARLSELWLMLGQRPRAVKKAEKARDLAPRLERTQTVFGYALLTRFEARQARETFAQAIALDPANPLPRFGLGLAKIRQGRLRGGRVDIESAVALDPDNALLRSYLGKAYFEERTTSVNDYFSQLIARLTGEEKPSLAGQQFAIAKDLDPNDPTPWFYDAIRKQSENRPVEALRDLEKSIELNDNRAVYRSRQLLDEDRAARGVSQARIYNDLGFEQLGINEATRSLSLDPSNAAAHRFLSDVYAANPGREIARVSELLKAQLLQDININPVQPSLSDTNLNIITRGGATSVGLNEYNPLFERNEAQFNLSGLIGNQDTRGEEAVVSGVYDNISLSAGQFYYRRNGFRRNFEVEHNIIDIFAQAAITPELNIQGEFRRRRSEEGDIDLSFDPDVFSEGLLIDDDFDSARIGVRYSPSKSSTVISSLIYTDFDGRIKEPDEGVFLELSSKSKAIQAEGQYIFESEQLDFQLGVSVFDTDDLEEDFEDGIKVFSEHISVKHEIGYIYGNINMPENTIWTLGISYDDYDEGNNIDIEKESPKIGVIWDITDHISARAAALRTVKPVLATSQTIQPTQVAGFNQFYDDINGTEAWLYGLGLDFRLSQKLFAGLEASHRDLSTPFAFEGVVSSQKEDLYRSYFFWTPHPQWSVSGETKFEIFKSDRDGTNRSFPKKVKTYSLPVTIRYFHPSGIFSGFGTSFVHQDVKREGSDEREGNDTFVVLDAVWGYRLYERRGIIAFEVRNLLDSGLKFQDDSFRRFSSEATVSPYLPERTFLFRASLNF